MRVLGFLGSGAADSEGGVDVLEVGLEVREGDAESLA